MAKVGKGIGTRSAGRTKDAGRPASSAKVRPSERLADKRIAFAMESLRRADVLNGAAAMRISVRVDPALLALARAKTGLETTSEIVTAALATLAAGDGFGAWLVEQGGRLPEDFELPL